MTTSFPRSPKTLKGGIIAVDSRVPIPTVIVFQYNPEKMTRTVTARRGSGGGSEATFISGPPSEQISIDIEIDATDQLETSDPIASTLGIYPQLSALETLLYPSVSSTIENSVLAAAGSREIVPPEGPSVLFVWGIKRVLPVQLSTLTISEQAFDANLNPIRAGVTLTLDVLTTHDFTIAQPGYWVHLAHQLSKELTAAISTTGDVASVLGGPNRLI